MITIYELAHKIGDCTVLDGITTHKELILELKDLMKKCGVETNLIQYETSVIGDELEQSVADIYCKMYKLQQSILYNIWVLDITTDDYEVSHSVELYNGEDKAIAALEEKKKEFSDRYNVKFEKTYDGWYANDNDERYITLKLYRKEVR